MGQRDKRELRHRLHVLVMHLLQWCDQPARLTWSGSWAGTIRQQRRQSTALLDDSPSLTAQVETLLERVYASARQDAAAATRLPLGVFSEMCPWMVQDLLDTAFWPQA